MPCEADVAEDRLTLGGLPNTDLFTDPRGEKPPKSGAPAFVTPLAGDFVLGARVEVDFASSFDGGGLVAYANDGLYAKLCFECSPELAPGIVSVVTRGVSDDCNSWEVEPGRPAWLRIARIGGAFAFHASDDGERWRFVRHFGLDTGPVVDVGFLAQAPHGEACEVRFTEIELERRTLADLRDGS